MRLKGFGIVIESLGLRAHATVPVASQLCYLRLVPVAAAFPLAALVVLVVCSHCQ